MAFSNNLLAYPIEDHYQTLGLQRRATPDMIVEAYRFRKAAVLEEMTHEIENGTEEPEINVLYVKPGQDSFQYITTETPRAGGMPQLQTISALDLQNIDQQNERRRLPPHVNPRIWYSFNQLLTRPRLRHDRSFDRINRDSLKALGFRTPVNQAIVACDMQTIRTYQECILIILQERKHWLPVQDHFLNPSNAKNQDRADKTIKAFSVLSNPVQRKAHDEALDAYFKKMEAALLAKDEAALKALLPGVNGESKISDETGAQTKPPYLGFEAQDKKGRTLIIRMLAWKDKNKIRDCQQFLIEKFRSHFNGYGLALLGADLSDTDNDGHQSHSGILFQYARGNHIQKVNEMARQHSRLLGEMGWEYAAKGYIMAGNAAEAEKALAKVNFRLCEPSTQSAFLEAGYLKKPSKMVQFFSKASPKFRDYLTKLIQDTPFLDHRGQPLPAAEKESQEKIALYAQAAGAGVKLNASSGSNGNGSTSKKQQIDDALKTIDRLSQLFDSSIDAASKIPIKDGAQEDRKKFVHALRAVKVKVVGDYLNKKFKKPDDEAQAIATAVKNLVNDIQDPAKQADAVKNFNQATQSYHTTWDWRRTLGTVIGCVIGLLLGLIIGAAIAPAAGLTALAGGWIGAGIGATLFGGVGNVVGRKLTKEADPYQQTISTASTLQSHLQKP